MQLQFPLFPLFPSFLGHFYFFTERSLRVCAIGKEERKTPLLLLLSLEMQVPKASFSRECGSPTSSSRVILLSQRESGREREDLRHNAIAVQQSSRIYEKERARNF